MVLATCPADWQSYGDKCFFFSRENETFADALVSFSYWKTNYWVAVTLLKKKNNIFLIFSETL